MGSETSDRFHMDTVGSKSLRLRLPAETLHLAVCAGGGEWGWGGVQVREGGLLRAERREGWSLGTPSGLGGLSESG